MGACWHQNIGTIKTTAERYGVPTEGIPVRLHDIPVFVNRRLRTTLGLACNQGLATWIEIHKAVFANPKQMRTTLAHEIAHVVVGPGHGHNQLWASTAKSIGGDGHSHYSRARARALGVCLAYRVVGHCEKCGADVKRARALNKRKRFTHSERAWGTNSSSGPDCGGDIVSGATKRTFMKGIRSDFLQKFLVGNYLDTSIRGVKLPGREPEFASVPAGGVDK